MAGLRVIMMEIDGHDIEEVAQALHQALMG